MKYYTLTLHDRGSLKSFRGDSGKREAGWFCIFLRQTTRKGGLTFHWGAGGVTSIETGMVVIVLLSFLTMII